MRKRLISLIVSVFILGIVGTAFAASPFVKVPAGHWAYDSIAKLAQAGIVDSYDDSTSHGKKTLTRYAMAMIVAEAMANADNANIEQKAEIEKLATEFKDELDHLGVNSSSTIVKNKPDNKPIVPSVSGYYYLRYEHGKNHGNPAADYHTLKSSLRLNAKTQINDDWTLGVSWENFKSLYKDKGTGGTNNSSWGSAGYQGAFDVTRAYVTGPVAGAIMTAGKFDHVFGSGILFDDVVSGVRFDFGKELKTRIIYAEADENVLGCTTAGSYLSKYAKAAAVDFNYGLSKATSMEASYQKWYSKSDGIDPMRVYDVNVTTRLNKDVTLFGTYGQTSADTANKAYVFGVSYKQYDKKVPGTYNFILDYEALQKNSVIYTTYWVGAGMKGLVYRFTYVPAKNMLLSLRYYDAKYFADNDAVDYQTAVPAGSRTNWFRCELDYYF
ncbi:hypothetical protein [Sporomusa acidovorans]|uniref:SLH domain-containing protein n=1 Tax=Sporomusa acidovorans (strain ATCC 49682 / DSM 3132 / Mol) TaxID=1123286 RepID=A0ABZ3IY01_SPOA4|nr:hypothetical protein [Sporomusa acidovorans]OZC22342.1 hypothetical protein SPACI_13910 [Sporomusa acidovorans DSM 3132]SDE46263.1 hypothetical protein SAMN04488499_101415 [Sporomusa acidovorans]